MAAGRAPIAGAGPGGASGPGGKWADGAARCGVRGPGGPGPGKAGAGQAVGGVRGKLGTSGPGARARCLHNVRCFPIPACTHLELETQKGAA